jgi:hypothetical protein
MLAPSATRATKSAPARARFALRLTEGDDEEAQRAGEQHQLGKKGHGGKEVIGKGREEGEKSGNSRKSGGRNRSRKSARR